MQIKSETVRYQIQSNQVSNHRNNVPVQYSFYSYGTYLGLYHTDSLDRLDLFQEFLLWGVSTNDLMKGRKGHVSVNPVQSRPRGSLFYQSDNNCLLS
jgi:hypothetical protein